MAVKYSSTALTHLYSLLGVEDWFTQWHSMTSRKSQIFTYTFLEMLFWMYTLSRTDMCPFLPDCNSFHSEVQSLLKISTSWGLLKLFGSIVHRTVLYNNISKNWMYGRVMFLFLATSVFDQWCGCLNCVFVPFSVEACYNINGNFAVIFFSFRGLLSDDVWHVNSSVMLGCKFALLPRTKDF